MRRWCVGTMFLASTLSSGPYASVALAQITQPPSPWQAALTESVAVSPQTTPPSVTGALTFEQSLRLASRYNPALTASLWSGRADVEHARGEATYENPTLEGSIENFGGELGTRLEERTLSLAQPIDIGGRRRALAGVVKGLRHQGEAGLDAQRRLVIRETADAFLDAWVLERRVALLRRAEAVSQSAIDAAHERTRIGAAPQTEALRAEAEWSQRSIERRQAEVDLGAARIALSLQWGGSTATFDSLTLPFTDIQPIETPESLGVLIDHSPDVVRAKAETDVAAARVRAAKAERLPPLTVLGGVRHLGDQQATGFIASLSAPIPIWNRNGPQIAAATADYNAALSRERTVRARLARDLGNAGQRLTSAYEAIQLAGKRALPAARQALEQLESGYRRGRFTYLDYTEGQRAVLEIQLLMNDTIRDYWKARLTLEGLPAGTGDSQP